MAVYEILTPDDCNDLNCEDVNAYKMVASFAHAKAVKNDSIWVFHMVK